MKDSPSLQLNWNNSQGIVGKQHGTNHVVRQNTYKNQKPPSNDSSIALWKVAFFLFAAAAILSCLK